MKKRQNEHMDEILRHRLEKATSPVPDDMWSRIEAARKVRRIHPLGWYYFSATILLVATVSLWLSLGTPAALDAPAIQSDSQEMQNNQTADRSITSKSTEIEENQDLNHSSSSQIEGHQDLSKQSSTGLQEMGSDRDVRVNNTADDSQQNSRKEQEASSLTKKMVGKSTFNSNQQTTTRKPGTADQADASARSTDDSSEDLRTRYPSNAAKTTSDQIHANTSEGAKPEVMEIDYRFATADQLAKKESTGVTSGGKQKIPGLSKKAKLKSSPSCYSFNSFLRGLSVDAYLAPEYASRQLVYKDPDMVGYAEQRNNDESYVFAYSAGFRVNAHFRGGLAVRSGLIYTDIVEKLQYRDENAQVTTVINVTLDTIYQKGNIVYVWDTLSVTEYGNYNKVGYNRYRFYDIPLMVGYEIDRGNWVIQLNTGILFNVAASQRGDFLDPDHQLVNFDSNNNQSYHAFRSRVGSSLLMSLGFNYALRPKLHLLVEPQLRVWLQPLNIQSYPVDQKYVNLGLAMGIRQYF